MSINYISLEHVQENPHHYMTHEGIVPCDPLTAGLELHYS